MEEFTQSSPVCVSTYIYEGLASPQYDDTTQLYTIFDKNTILIKKSYDRKSLNLLMGANLSACSGGFTVIFSTRTRIDALNSRNDATYILLNNLLTVREVKALIIEALEVDHPYFQSLAFEEFYIGCCPLFVKSERHLARCAILVGTLAGDPQREKPCCGWIGNTTRHLIKVRNGFAYALPLNTFVGDSDGGIAGLLISKLSDMFW